MDDLIITNLSKTYNNGVKALQNISLQIPKGMFGLLGPNGAGKSTHVYEQRDKRETVWKGAAHAELRNEIRSDGR